MFKAHHGYKPYSNSPTNGASIATVVVLTTTTKTTTTLPYKNKMKMIWSECMLFVLSRFYETAKLLGQKSCKQSIALFCVSMKTCSLTWMYMGVFVIEWMAKWSKCTHVLIVHRNQGFSFVKIPIFSSQLTVVSDGLTLKLNYLLKLFFSSSSPSLCAKYMAYE